MNNYFSSGNVVSKPSFFNKKERDVYVVIDGDEKFVTLLPFDSSNCTHHIAKEQRKIQVGCDCVEVDCKQCKGTGRYTQVQPCWADLTVEADNIKQYIVKSMLKGFVGLS